MISLGFTAVANSFAFNVTGPKDASDMPLGQYMLFVVSDGVPSTAVWVTLAEDFIPDVPMVLCDWVTEYGVVLHLSPHMKSFQTPTPPPYNANYSKS